jgi:hypothetical protein
MKPPAKGASIEALASWYAAAWRHLPERPTMPFAVKDWLTSPVREGIPEEFRGKYLDTLFRAWRGPLSEESLDDFSRQTFVRLPGDPARFQNRRILRDLATLERDRLKKRKGNPEEIPGNSEGSLTAHPSPISHLPSVEDEIPSGISSAAGAAAVPASEEETSRKPSSTADAESLSAFVVAWNALAAEQGLPTVQVPINQTRRRKLAARLRERPDLFAAIVEPIRERSDFCRENRFPTFDQVCSPVFLSKLLEGNYAKARKRFTW